MPDQGWLERARAETPEVYNTYVQGMKDSFKTDNIVRREEARAPRQVTIGGQVTALIGLSLVLALAGYLAFLGYPVTAGIVAALDLVGIIAAFASQRPNQPHRAPRGQANNNEGEDAESTRRIAETTAGAAVVCSYCCTTRASSPPPAKVNVHVRPLVIGLPVRPRKLDLQFTGRLRPDQHRAVRAILKHQDGVLVAPPGTGKTVIACALIAERSVATAILVNRAELLHQWRDRLTTFLDIEDQRIGQLGSGRKKRTGVIDLIMMQSISRKGSDPNILEEYGQVIVDECHAIAAPSTEAAIRTVNVKHWVGLTATPFRSDQMDGLITMQCGPIRHQIEAERDEDRRLVIHRTSFTTEEPGSDGPSIQAIYSELSHDASRNALIVDEIVRAAEDRRTCMVLTNRVDHLKYLDARVSLKVPGKVFTLHGQLTAQERRAVRQEIAETDRNGDPFVLIAIDKIAGEGLDIPTMDTLFLAMPVSFKGRIIQQAGRVTRGGHQGSAVVHDFRDAEVPLLERMHRRRRRTLEGEGFKLEQPAM